MTPTAFRRSLAQPRPPAGLPPALAALWWAAKDDWSGAHDIVMAHESDPDCAWVHAYLHRAEGDLANARYWYRLAGKPAAAGSLDAELNAIMAVLLGAAAGR